MGVYGPNVTAVMAKFTYLINSFKEGRKFAKRKNEVGIFAMKLFPTFFGYETFPDIFWLTTCQAISTLKKKHAVPTANRNTEASCTDSQQEHIPRVTIHQLPMTDL